MMRMSQRSFDLIVNEETGGEEYYIARERHTDWPGGSSGVTVACGYDCGYETAQQIAADWMGRIPISMVQYLQDVAGVHGSPARSLAHEIAQHVTIPWETAIEMFRERDVPRWESIVARELPNTDKLSPDSFGALVSVAFNRGASFNLLGDRYLEMRGIKWAMAAGNFGVIPGYIRHMQRLWPPGGDLWQRREHEAKLFQDGLSTAT
jgi:GH24 family phage-related lysozyme (muramidase)